MNHRLTTKDKGLLRGGIRRVFSRSALRIAVIDACLIKHTDVSRSRVKAWGKCNDCKKPTPKSYLVVDHILPVISIEETADVITFDEFIDRLWCHPSNLQALCKECHEVKTQAENKLRRQFKKQVKNTITQG